MIDQSICRWTAAGQTVRGAQHVKSGKPNQDYCRFELVGDQHVAVVLALSDGHGSDHCVRSDVGAKFAVETAIKLITNVISHHAVVASPEVLERAWAKLPQMLTEDWIERVREHHRSTPFSAQEEIQLRQTTRDPLELAYGATVLAVVATETYLMFLQLGDGEILMVSDDSDRSVWPLSKDASLIANETTSLCMPNAHLLFRRVIVPIGAAPPRLILATTDGYPNSFQTVDDFEQVGRDYRNAILRDGLDAVEAKLEGWLNQASSEGSGDDCTVGLVWREKMPVASAGSETGATPSPM